MQVAVFSTKPYDERSLNAANEKAGSPHQLTFLEPRLTRETAILAYDFPAICAFVNDNLDDATLRRLNRHGVKLIAMRSAGYNNINLETTRELGMTVVRVPAYSPYAVAEHTVALMLALNRKIYRAYDRVREHNFSLEGLLGFDMHGRTVGVIGTGKIGAITANILLGFGCHVLAYDIYPNADLQARGAQYVTLDELFRQSDIITLHTPLMPETYHIINETALDKMKPGVMIVNTSRGALIDAAAAIEALKSGKIGYLGLDVYEEEADLFFEDLSSRVIQDDIFARLLTFPNVVITGHQAFFTQNALENIADTTIENIREFELTGTCRNIVK